MNYILVDKLVNYRLLIFTEVLSSIFWRELDYVFFKIKQHLLINLQTQMIFVAPVTEHVPLHSKSSCKSIVRASGGANNMYPLSWGGGTNGKDTTFHLVVRVFTEYVNTIVVVSLEHVIKSRVFLFQVQ